MKCAGSAPLPWESESFIFVLSVGLLRRFRYLPFHSSFLPASSQRHRGRVNSVPPLLPSPALVAQGHALRLGRKFLQHGIVNGKLILRFPRAHVGICHQQSYSRCVAAHWGNSERNLPRPPRSTACHSPRSSSKNPAERRAVPDASPEFWKISCQGGLRISAPPASDGNKERRAAPLARIAAPLIGGIQNQ